MKKKKPEIKYFLTVQWCKSGPRGVLCDRDGIGYWRRRRPHTEEEMNKKLGHFWVILDPKSEPYTFDMFKKLNKWKPLAEYRNEIGIAYAEGN